MGFENFNFPRMTNFPKSAFLFDLDGVLIDSEKEYSRIWSEIDRRYPTGVADFSKVIKGRTLTEILNLFFPGKELQINVTSMLNDLEQKMHYHFCPGAQSLLTWLNDANVPLALVTSSNGDKMAHLHDEIPGFEDYFTHIVTADLISRSKPDPEGYLLGARLCGVAPEHCAVFEDSKQGVMAGRAAGAFVIGVAGTLPAADIAPFSDLVVDSLNDVDAREILKILEQRTI